MPRFVAALVVVAVLAAGCSGGSSGPRSAGRPGSSDPAGGGAATSLRTLAERRHVLLGTAVDDAALTGEPDYARVLGEQFDLVTPENASKWDATEPSPGRFDFSGLDRLVAFAGAHHQQVKGGILVWYFQNPDWLEHATFTRDQAIEVLRRHIQAEVGHLKGKVVSWDVVNEPLDDGGAALRQNVWMRLIGPDYIPMAFRFAHQADPGAKLYLNDFDVQMPGPKTDRMVQMALDLKAQGVPIDGLGSQFHLFPGFTTIDEAAVARQMARVNAAGLDVAVSEWDLGAAAAGHPGRARPAGVRARRPGPHLPGRRPLPDVHRVGLHRPPQLDPRTEARLRRRHHQRRAPRPQAQLARPRRRSPLVISERSSAGRPRPRLSPARSRGWR